MRNTDWSPTEIHQIASTSGRPLEVRCAEVFLKSSWTARLGSYYADGAFDVPRELDVLAERRLELPSGVTAGVRALVSCRGFPEERSPFFYSVSRTSGLTYAPHVFVEHRWPPGQNARYGPLADYEIKSAMHTLEIADLMKARPIVGFDIIERSETVSKQEKKKPDPQPNICYARIKEGDSYIFKAIDSAIKAAFFWRQEDYQRADAFVTMNIPVCILSSPFWDVCLDDGRIGQPELFNKGWTVSLFPMRPYAKELMCLIWSTDQLEELVMSLNKLFSWFVEEASTLYSSARTA